MRPAHTLVVFAFAFSLPFTQAFARTWRILPDGTGDAPTIQAGMDLSAAGDTVLLADGEFAGTGNWNLDFHGKAIVVRSESGDPEDCSIALGSLYAHRGFNFHSGEGPDSRVEGVTIADGYHSQGAGILVQGASPSIVNCRILRCVAQTDGGAVLCRDDASPVFVGCTFANNKAALYGGGIRLMLRTEADLSACTFRGNTSSRGGGIYSYGGTVALSGSAFLDNRAEEDGGAIYLHGDDGAIRDCLFARNEAETGMGGAACFSNSSPAVTGCTFWGNAAAVAGGIHLRIAAHPSIQNTVIASSKRGCAIYGSDPGYEPVLSCSDLWGNPGGDWISYIAVQNGTSGNFSSDPQFCDAAGGDFTLASTSPCLPGGHPDAFPCGRIGVYEEGCTGPTAVERATWGGIKAMWR